MAKSLIPANLLSTQGGVVTMSMQRKEAARQAAFEIELMSVGLRKAIEGGDCIDLIVRGMTKRMEAMAQAILSSIEDEYTDVETLFQDIGCNMPEAAATTTAGNPSPVTDDLTSDFCRINTLLDTMKRNVQEMNNSDFDTIEALVPAVQREVDHVWSKVEKFAAY